MTNENHEANKILPAMSEREYEDLKESINRNGLRKNVIMLGNQVIAGWHRFRACKELGINPICVQYDPQRDGADLVEFILDEDINRRHLTADQRATIAVRLLELGKVQQAATEASATPTDPASQQDKTSEPEPTKPDGTTEPEPTEDEKLMKRLNIGAKKLQEAKWVAKRDASMLDRVADGELTLEEARKAIEKRNSASTYRIEAADMLAANLGDETAERIRNQEILDTDKELRRFANLEINQQKQILEMIDHHGIEVQQAIKWAAAAWAPADRLSSVIEWAKAEIDRDNRKTPKAEFSIEGFHITITKR